MVVEWNGFQIKPVIIGAHLFTEICYEIALQFENNYPETRFTIPLTVGRNIVKRKD